MPTLLHALGAFIVPALAFLGLWLGGAWLFLPALWSMGLAVALDAILPEDRRFAVPEGGIGWGGLVWLVFPVLAALVLYGLHTVATRELGWWEVLGAATAVGLANGGVGLTAAHELVHRPRRWERGLGVALASLVLNAQFRVEHVFGHHRTVGTPSDPTTARLGESLHAYLPRAFFGSVAESWRLEADRMRKRGLPALHWRNRMVHYAVLHEATVLAVAWLFGGPALAFFLAQSVIAIQLLQTTGYIEHYGLERGRTPRGTWERMGPQHSWNSAHRLTNWMTFNLGLHAEHHTWPAKPYPELVDHAEAMRMPFGYPAMVMLAMVPPLWFRVMDRRVRALRGEGAVSDRSVLAEPVKTP